MPVRPSYTHVFNLVLELRQAAIENRAQAKQWDVDGFGLNLGADLANDAAETLEALLAERPANEQRGVEATAARF